MIHHESFTHLGLVQMVQLSIVIAFAALVGLAVRRRPHVAHAVWLLVFIKALIPPVWSSPVGLFSLAAASRAAPVATFETPAIRVADAHVRGVEQRDQVHAEVAQSAPSNRPTIAASQESFQSAIQGRGGFALDTGYVLLSVWIGGALLAIAIPLIRSIGVRRYVLRHGIDPPESIMDQLERVCCRVGLKGRRRVLVSPRQFGPAVVGIFSPLIVLPASLVDGPLPALSAAYSHELIHLRRRDQLIALLQWAATAVWWFYLPIWWVNRQFTAAREASCDEEAIAAMGCPPADYAQMLLDVVRGRRTGRGGALSLGVSPLQISTRRLEHVMDPRTRFYRRTPVLAWAIFCALALALVPGAGLALQSEGAGNTPAAQGEKPVETMHFSGRVVDADSKAPIEGATVVVHRFNSSSSGRMNSRAAADTELKTDASGKFTFDVPPDEQGKHLYLELDVRHPRYASRNGEGYGLSLIKRDLALGNQPWFKEIALRAGEEITGRLLDWTGKPAANVLITYTAVAGPYDQRFMAREENRVDDKTTTDADGRFRFNVTKGAEIGCFWAIPDDGAVLFYNIRDQRGNVGTFRLEPGISVPGTVLTFDGKPVPNVGVTLESVETNEDHNAVTSRDTQTDANGKFKLKPVRPGVYELEVTDWIRDDQSGTYKSAFIPGAFTKQRIVVEYKSGKIPPVEIRAVEHVVVAFQYLDSRGKPRSGHEVILFSGHGEESYIQSANPDANGLIQMLVPKGLKDVRVELINDPYSSLRWRRGINGELNSIQQIELGTLEHDVKDLFLVRYEAPVLIVRAVGPDGSPIPDFRPSITFPDAGPIIKATRWNNGIQGDVGFDKQDDGSWRSVQLLPDLELTISASADGYTAATQKMTLKEKETRDVTVVMSKR